MMAFASFVIIFFCAVILNLSVRYRVRSHITLLKVGNAIECAQSCSISSAEWNKNNTVLIFKKKRTSAI